MKIYCNKNTLLNTINTVQKAAAVNSTLPILESILIEANENLKLTGNNLELGIECYIDVTIKESGSIALNSRVFGEIIKKLPENTIYIETDENNNAYIKSGNAEYKIIGLSAEDFAELPKVEKNDYFKISQKNLKDMINQVMFAVSNNENNPILTGCYLEIENKYLNMVSVDGYRLALRKEEIKEGNKEINMIVPGKTLNEISKILKEDDEKEVDIYSSEKHVLFEFDNCRIVSRLIEGEFLKYKQIIPESQELKVKVDVINFIESIERTALIIVSDNQKYPIKLNIKTDKINMTCTTQTGTANDIISAETTGEDIEIGFNYRYLLDALKACERKDVYLEFTNNVSPCIIKPIEDNKFIYLVLPVRLKNE